MEFKKPVENVLEQTLKNLRSIIDVNCIIGESIKSEENTIIPISKVTVGFLSGGGEYNSKDKKLKSIFSYPFAGGSGGGCNIFPIGFLVINRQKVEFLKVENESNFDKLIEILCEITKTFK